MPEVFTEFQSTVSTIAAYNSVCKETKFSPFRLLYGEELVTPKEIRLRSARTRAKAIHKPTEAESKDLLKSDCI
jgi:hypothetical protein